jgi:glutamine amidotransferase/cyclase
MPSFKVSLLDYGAGNVRSVRNAILAQGYEIEDITHPSQIDQAKVIIFPGVGSFGSAMKVLKEQGYDEPLRQYLANTDRPFLGICLGMQTLFDSSDEQHEEGCGQAIPGLGVIPGRVIKFDETHMAVPHIGWNGRRVHQESGVLRHVSVDEQVYFVHSYYAPITDENREWVLTSTTYSGQPFISAVQRGCVVATQFHPEKSGTTGLHFLQGFLEVRIEHGRRRVMHNRQLTTCLLLVWLRTVVCYAFPLDIIDIMIKYRRQLKMEHWAKLIHCLWMKQFKLSW